MHTGSVLCRSADLPPDWVEPPPLHPAPCRCSPGDSADRTYPYKPDTFPCNSATNNSAVWEQECEWR